METLKLFKGSSPGGKTDRPNSEKLLLTIWQNCVEFDLCITEEVI